MRRARFVPLVLITCGAALLSGCGKAGAHMSGPGILAEGRFAGPLNAAGETPFWSVRIREQGLFYTAPDRQQTTYPISGPNASGDQAIWTSKTPDGKSLKLTLSAKPCQDQATSIAYPFTASIEVGGQTMQGCATKAGEGLGSRE